MATKYLTRKTNVETFMVYGRTSDVLTKIPMVTVLLTKKTSVQTLTV